MPQNDQNQKTDPTQWVASDFDPPAVPGMSVLARVVVCLFGATAIVGWVVALGWLIRWFPVLSLGALYVLAFFLLWGEYKD